MLNVKKFNFILEIWLTLLISSAKLIQKVGKPMVLYFSGTGNSAYVAKKIATQIQDEAVDLFCKIRTHDCSEIHSERPWVFVVPVYAWQMPQIVSDWISKTTFTGSKDGYFVITCGQSIGGAGEYARRLWEPKGLIYKGCSKVVMPENYLLMFPVPDEAGARQIIAQANPVIDYIAAEIGKAEILDEKVSLGGKLSSGLVNTFFYKCFVSAKKFYSLDTCTSCGYCETVCPLNNIRLVDGRPLWGEACTHCCACICKCPQEAIEYGKASVGKPRYICPIEV